jgi:hypothetical protein
VRDYTIHTGHATGSRYSDEEAVVILDSVKEFMRRLTPWLRERRQR